MAAVAALGEGVAASRSLRALTVDDIANAPRACALLLCACAGHPSLESVCLSSHFPFDNEQRPACPELGLASAALIAANAASGAPLRSLWLHLTGHPELELRPLFQALATRSSLAELTLK